MAAAIEWVGRITAVGIEMVLPGLAGKWLDDHWRTGPLLTFAGFAIGMILGIWHLLRMTSRNNSQRSPRRDKKSDQK